MARYHLKNILNYKQTEFGKEIVLLRDCKTRWSSLLLMLERFFFFFLLKAHRTLSIKEPETIEKGVLFFFIFFYKLIPDSRINLVRAISGSDDLELSATAIVSRTLYVCGPAPAVLRDSSSSGRYRLYFVQNQIR